MEQPRLSNTQLPIGSSRSRITPLTNKTTLTRKRDEREWETFALSSQISKLITRPIMALGLVHLINSNGQTWWSNALRSWKMHQPPHSNPSQRSQTVVGSSSNNSSFLAFNPAIISSLGRANFSLQHMDGSIMFRWIIHFKLQLRVTSALGQVAQR